MAMDAHERLEMAAAKTEVFELKSEVFVLKSEIISLKLIITTLVTRPEFTPVKLIVYGLVGSILAGVIGAMLSKLIIK